MFFLIIYLTGLLATLACLAMAGYQDTQSLTIHNRYTGLIAGLFVATTVFLLPADATPLPTVLSSLLAGGIMFLVTFILFAIKVLGAADSKIASATALWTGSFGLPAFLFYVTLSGGAIALFLIILRRFPKAEEKLQPYLPFIMNKNGHIPYGIAIAIGALVTFVHLGYFKYGTFANFIN